MKTQTEKLNVRDFVTIAILTVVELAVYFVIGMPLGSTPLSWIFCLGIQALPLGIVFMLMYTKVRTTSSLPIELYNTFDFCFWASPVWSLQAFQQQAGAEHNAASHKTRFSRPKMPQSPAVFSAHDKTPTDLR